MVRRTPIIYPPPPPGLSLTSALLLNGWGTLYFLVGYLDIDVYLNTLSLNLKLTYLNFRFEIFYFFTLLGCGYICT